MDRNVNVVVVGSINMDLVVKTIRFPEIGETILGEYFEKRTGGKGANQAVAASRLGANVSMIGVVGDDNYGEELKDSLIRENVNVQGVEKSLDLNSGTALITLTENNNHIIVIPGANYNCTPKMVNKQLQLIKNADIILLQLEIPIDTVRLTIDLADYYCIPVILNPAPAYPLSKDILRKVTYLVPNESELETLGKENLSMEQNIYTLQNQGVPYLIVTKGKKGVFYTKGDDRVIHHFDSHRVKTVDTTGAGDAFIAALAVALAEKKTIHQSVEFANATGALAVTKEGSLDGMPYRNEVEKLLEV